jgi:hypothetical protein
MEHFEIKNRSFIMIRRGLGAFLILAAVADYILFTMDVQKIIYLITAFLFAFAGIYQITNGLGLERSWFRTGSDFIIIKWSNMINPVQIHDIRIAKILLTKSRILIHQHSKKPLKLNIEFLEKEQKKEIYEFFIDYSNKKNIELVKQFS